MLALGDHVAFGAPSKHKPHGPPSFSDRDERVLTKVHPGEKLSTSCGQGTAKKLGIAAIRHPGFLLAKCVHQTQVPGTVPGTGTDDNEERTMAKANKPSAGAPS